MQRLLPHQRRDEAFPPSVRTKDKNHGASFCFRHGNGRLHLVVRTLDNASMNHSLRVGHHPTPTMPVLRLCDHAHIEADGHRFRNCEPRLPIGIGFQAQRRRHAGRLLLEKLYGDGLFRQRASTFSIDDAHAHRLREARRAERQQQNRSDVEQAGAGQRMPYCKSSTCCRQSCKSGRQGGL